MSQLPFSIAASDKEATALQKVVAAARAGLNPTMTTVGLQPLYHSAPGTYPFSSVTQWQSAGLVSLPFGSADPAQPQSLRIWTYPQSLTNLPHAVKDPTLLPRFTVQVGTYNDATAKMERADAGYYGFGTLIRVAVKRLPAVSGSPATTCTYELVGANEYDLVLLERLLSVMSPTAGTAFVQNIALLYHSAPSGGSTSGGLQSDAPDKVHLGITQVNLTTETKPPQLGAPAPDKPRPQTPGCFNTPFEFVKLLWECSITRSGGFYLYYYNEDAKSGFPGSIFNDQGEATLSLLISYAAPDCRVAGYMNCAVTGSFIDITQSVVYAIAAPLPFQYAPTSADTLASIAEAYYANPVQLAEENAGLPLAGTAVLDLNGGLYRSGAQPMAPDTLLTTLAGQFKVQSADLKLANPDLNWTAQVPPYRAIRLPHKQFQVGEIAGLSTIRQIADYYGIRMAQVAVDNQERPKLFDRSLTVSGGPMARTAAVPPGVVPVEAQRPVPGPVPDDPNADGYGETYLEHLYMLLGYEIWQNPWFKQSNPGLPMGPVNPGSPEPGIRKLQVAPSPQDVTTWTFRQSVPYAHFALTPAAAADNRLSDPGQSPYAGVGGLLQVDFDWTDIFGNRTLTSLEDAAGNRFPVRAGWTDQLISLGQWPAVSSQYRIGKPDSGPPELQIALNFDPTDFNPPKQQDGPPADPPAWQQAALKAQVAYERLCYQLGESIGSTSAVTFTVETTLLQGAPTPVDSAQVAALKGWIGQICAFVTARAQGDTTHPGPPPFTPPLSLPIVAGAVNPAQIFELTASFVMSRPVALVDPDFLDTPAVYRSSTVLSPQLAPDGGSLTLRQFALDLEGALSDPAAYQLKVAAGVDRERVSQSRLDSPLWVVWMARHKGGPGIWYAVTNPGAPLLFAPRPIYNTLQTHTVPIYPYTTGSGIDNSSYTDMLFSNVDVDGWARQFLEAVDRVLSPEFVVPARILAVLQSPDPQQKVPDYIHPLLDAKQQLAGALSNLVTPLLKGMNPTGAQSKQARESFRQQLLVELARAYTTNAIIQFQGDVQADVDDGDAPPPRLYGGVAQSAGTAGVTLTSPKLQLATPSDDNPALLTFLLSVNQSQQPDPQHPTARYTDLTLTYQPGNIEHQIGSLPFVPDYQASSWLGFVVPLDTPLPLGNFQVPLVLRAFPTPPTMVGQVGATATDPSGSALDKACLWDYAFTYGVDYHYEQDRAYFTVRFNEADLFKFSGIPDLFEALAEFIAVYPAVETDLVKYLAPITQATTDPTAMKNAMVALGTFTQLVQAVATVWSGMPPLTDLSGMQRTQPLAAPSLLTYPFELDEQVVAGGSGPQLQVRLAGGAPPGDDLPAVTIDGYSMERAPAAGGWSYGFKKGGQYLDGSGLGIKNRTVTLPSLNILALQDARTEVYIVRNQFLLPDPTRETADPFVYKTGTVAFPDPLHPMLDSDAPIELSLIGSPDGQQPVTRSLAGHLSALLQALFAKEPLSRQHIQLECRYQFELNPALSPVSLPVLLLPPTEIDVKADTQVPPGGCQPGAGDPLVCQLANAVTSWFQANQPSAAGGTLCLDLTVMSGLTKNPAPLVRLRGLTLQLGPWVQPPLPTR